MIRHVVIAAAIWFACDLQPGNGSRILCVFPTASFSHQMIFRGLTLALNERGHQLVVATPHPTNDPTLKNYTEIDINVFRDTVSVMNSQEKRGTETIIDFMKQMDAAMPNPLDQILSISELSKLYAPQSNEKFDLLIVELFYWPGILPLAKRFNVPTIGMTSLGLTLNNHYAIGNPILPSHLSNWELSFKEPQQLSFWKRLKNFITVWRHIYWCRTTFVALQHAAARRHFGDDIPPLSEFERNISLIFVNQEQSISYPIPSVPKVIYMNGFQILNKTSALPKDLRNILDKATAGFIYMSLGSTMPCTILSSEAINEFVTVFAKLPYEVLWKCESDFLPNKPDNLHVLNWIPQQAVLAHPNLKVFIYQGGLQSTEEAIANAVPLIGFPRVNDQEMQVMKMVSLGVAIRLKITAVDGNELYEAINIIANDNSYKQRMLNLRSLINDKPHDPLENAVWWTEHVIRHRGAPHLHSTTADDPWYSRQDMDIVAFLSSGFVIIMSRVLIITYRITKGIFARAVRSRDLKLKFN